MENILITGVSKGVGLKITQLLLEKNYRVYDGIIRSTNDQVIASKKNNTRKVFIISLLTCLGAEIFSKKYLKALLETIFPYMA